MRLREKTGQEHRAQVEQQTIAFRGGELFPMFVRPIRSGRGQKDQRALDG
jgi:hypothetical protein